MVIYVGACKYMENVSHSRLIQSRDIHLDFLCVCNFCLAATHCLAHLLRRSTFQWLRMVGSHEA